MEGKKEKTEDLADKLTKEFSRILRKEREKRGISQEKLAKMMGISGPYYSKLERNDRRIHMRHLADWCAAMNVSPMVVLEKWSRSKYAKEIDKERIKEYRRTIEEMIEFTNLYGSKVDFIEDNEQLKESGGIGAILRYS